MDNQDHKTINYLKSKVWYRILKVLFFLGLLLVLVIFNTTVFSLGVKQVDQNKTKIQCGIQYYINTVPQGYRQFSLNDLGLNLYFGNGLGNGFNYKDFYNNPDNEFEVKTILSKCSGVYDLNNINLSLWQAFADIPKDNPTATNTSEVVAIYNSYIKDAENNGETVDDAKNTALGNLETYDSHQFDITPIFSYNNFLELFLIGNAVILILFEAIRRIFYYVVLGRIRPEKGN